jgi:hypothetical protein
MPQERNDSPVRLSRLEAALVGIIIALSLAIGWARVDHRMVKAYASFQDMAPMVQKALEHFAQDHDGRFPPAVAPGLRPPYLSSKYIDWNPEWGIAYDARPKVKPDGRYHRNDCYVCLEFMPPPSHKDFHRLCRYKQLRAQYGRGQSIPGESNRIWVIRESAKVLPLPPPPPPPAGKPEKP